MRLPVKHVKMRCWGPIAVGGESGWEDVWATLFIGRRQKRTFGPCIISMPSLEFDLENLIRRKNLQDFYDTQVIKNRLLSGERFVADRMKNDGRWGDGDMGNIPNIYTNEPFITRRVAEDATWWWLLENKWVSSGVRPRFQWEHPSLVIVPVG